MWVRSRGRGGRSPGPAGLEQVRCSEVGGPGGLDQKSNTVVPGILVKGCAEAMAEPRHRGEWAAVLEKEGNGGLEPLGVKKGGWLSATIRKLKKVSDSRRGTNKKKLNSVFVCSFFTWRQCRISQLSEVCHLYPMDLLCEAPAL